MRLINSVVAEAARAAATPLNSKLSDNCQKSSSCWKKIVKMQNLTLTPLIL